MPIFWTQNELAYLQGREGGREGGREDAGAGVGGKEGVMV